MRLKHRAADFHLCSPAYWHQ